MTDGISFNRHRFAPAIIRYAVWLYFRFTLSVGDVEELLAERWVEVSRQVIRSRAAKFSPKFAANLKRSRIGRGHALTESSDRPMAPR